MSDINANLTPAQINASLLEKKPREVKLHKFADGEYRVPTEYVCTRCGKKYHVRQEVLITRIEKQYGNSMQKFIESAVCSSCKKSDKLDEQIAKLQAEKAKREAK